MQRQARVDLPHQAADRRHNGCGIALGANGEISACRTLQMRHVNGWRGSVAQSGKSRITDDANDLNQSLISEFEMFPQRIAIWKMHPRECFVHDRNFRARRIVDPCEIPPQFQRDLHRLEIAVANAENVADNSVGTTFDAKPAL